MLKINAVCKTFEKNRLVLNGINLTIETGEVAVLLGNSGSGKTTLLRCIAGLTPTDSGTIQIFHQAMEGVHPSERKVGFLFQNFALFPHLSVYDNILVGLSEWKRSEALACAKKWIEICGLGDVQNQMPNQLSGGQQQRTALARALAPQPQILLMDEPFSSLDPELRSRLSLEIRDILKKHNVTALIVTHQIEEAYDLADKIGVINAGVLEQYGTPYEIYHQPKSAFVARYTERASFVDVQVDEEGHVILGEQRLQVTLKGKRNQTVKLLVRPDDIQHDDASNLKAEVIEKHFRGSWFLYGLRLQDGGVFYSHVPSHHDHQIGEMIGIRFELDHIVHF